MLEKHSLRNGNVGCDFLGLGLHSFRRANITLRQEEGGSAIEASKIAGHATVSQTGDYTIVQLKRQDELTLAIQVRLSEAAAKVKNQAVTIPDRTVAEQIEVPA
jgi:hypothetical protein